MSLRTAKPPSYFTRPMAMPATGFLMGTPASMSASVLPHALAMDEEPLDSSTSDTTRMVYGNSSSGGMTGSRSEEHTSELQSRPHLVCRLLLEKKKISTRM